MKKAMKLNKTVLKAIMEVTKAEVEKDSYVWRCGAIYHQPKRPK
ncbi:cyclic lactone autoinducer peptide [Candidatus Galacturonibacter soehngenii]|uniref:Cyclic lactone autoinducer peptide n=1 Tax=Candidatus Galacturonatibacter soehngenii TaxID=2307010 RepID=A0A7V7QKV0_9FIRM|nr:cyclic lactone autoinducer peptide [Candidatus Galacturonibacter soehngenii]KAB1438474.1 cyclic lactone autoinducer peptide [Candidatus Galacturonibacter soehngenii]